MSIELAEPDRIRPDSSVKVVLRYTNRNQHLTHYVREVSISPTWNLSCQSTHEIDCTIPANTTTRLESIEFPTPPGLGGQQGFDVRFEVTVSTEDGETATDQQRTPTPLLVPVTGAPEYQTVVCTAGTDELPKPVLTLLQNWGFDFKLVDDIQAVQNYFDRADDTPTCFVGILPATTDDRGQQVVGSAAWVADDHDAMSFIFADEASTLPDLPPVRNVFIGDLTDERQLMRASGPEFLVVRRAFQTGQWKAVMEWLREHTAQARHEPKELLREGGKHGSKELLKALASAVILEKTTVDERIAEAIDIPDSIATGLTKPTAPHRSWPMFHADRANTGFHPTEQGPEDDITERWTVDTDAGVFSSPAVVDGTVYVGSYDNSVYAVTTA